MRPLGPRGATMRNSSEQHGGFTGRAGVVRSAMDRELVRNERQRVRVLVALLLLLQAMLLAVYFMPGLVQPHLRERVAGAFWPFSGLVGGYLVYELAVLVWLARRLAHGEGLPKVYAFSNAFIEASLPTLALWLGAPVLGHFSVLAGAVPMLYVPFIALSALNLSPAVCVFAGSVACVEFAAMSVWLIETAPPLPRDGPPILSMVASPHQYLMKSVLFLAAGCITAFVAARIRLQLSRVLETVEERDRAVSIFGQHVSPQVAELLLKQPVAGAGRERNVCVMFLDIRDFSRYANERQASEVVEYLNTLFGFMIPAVNAHRGIVNKFLGDGFMAVFGAPVDDGEQCRHAIVASQEILLGLTRLNQEGKIPPTRIGIGLHMGPAITGNVGAEDRKEYTVIGDTVNVAARIEQATKSLGASLLISEVVRRAIGDTGEFPTIEDMGPIELKGQAQPVRLFRLA